MALSCHAGVYLQRLCLCGTQMCIDMCRCGGRDALWRTDFVFILKAWTVGDSSSSDLWTNCTSFDEGYHCVSTYSGGKCSLNQCLLLLHRQTCLVKWASEGLGSLKYYSE